MLPKEPHSDKLQSRVAQGDDWGTAGQAGGSSEEAAAAKRKASAGAEPGEGGSSPKKARRTPQAAAHHASSLNAADDEAHADGGHSGPGAAKSATPAEQGEHNPGAHGVAALGHVLSNKKLKEGFTYMHAYRSFLHR